VAIHSQAAALTNAYICNDDVLQHTYWMRQFYDKSLFPADPLTAYAKAFQSWGIVFLYRVFSCIIDPMTFGKILPVFFIDGFLSVSV